MPRTANWVVMSYKKSGLLSECYLCDACYYIFLYQILFSFIVHQGIPYPIDSASSGQAWLLLLCLSYFHCSRYSRCWRHSCSLCLASFWSTFSFAFPFNCFCQFLLIFELYFDVWKYQYVLESHLTLLGHHALRIFYISKSDIVDLWYVLLQSSM
jgi:hypothetical protein